MDGGEGHVHNIHDQRVTDKYEDLAPLYMYQTMPHAHLTEVTRERALMLYAIAKGLSINVGL